MGEDIIFFSAAELCHFVLSVKLWEKKKKGVF